MVLITPAIEWVGLPLDAVTTEAVVLPRGVITTLGLVRHHDLTQMLTEVWGSTLLMVHLVEGGGNREAREGVSLCLGEVTSLDHLLEDGIATLQW